jgi:hypothetical protein
VRLRLAPPPALDLALLLQQGEILERANLMIELGGIDRQDLDELLFRTHEYCVLAESGRLTICASTKEQLHRNYAALKSQVASWREAQKYLAPEGEEEGI